MTIQQFPQIWQVKTFLTASNFWTEFSTFGNGRCIHADHTLTLPDTCIRQTIAASGLFMIHLGFFQDHLLLISTVPQCISIPQSVVQFSKTTLGRLYFFFNYFFILIFFYFILTAVTLKVHSLYVNIVTEKEHTRLKTNRGISIIFFRIDNYAVAKEIIVKKYCAKAS